MSHKIVRDRLRRIEYLKKLHENHKDWPEEKLVTIVALETGVKPYTVRKYIELLKEAGQW
jgi:hypothetical protein